MKFHRRKIEKSIWSTVAFLSILFYQNCSGGFHSGELGQGDSSSSNTVDTPPAPSPQPNPAPAPAPTPAPISQPTPAPPAQPMPSPVPPPVTNPTPNPTPMPPPVTSPTPMPTPNPSPYASIDDVIASMPANSWKALPGTMMKDACPQPLNEYACWAVVGAWSGGAYDDKRDRLFLYGGGHADSWYNNIFSFDVIKMKWERLTEMPAGYSAKAPAHWDDIRVETCGYYPKGILMIPADFMKGTYVDPEKCFLEPLVSQLDFQKPRSAHTYGQVFFDRLNDRYCSIAKAFYPSSQAETQVTNCFDPKTGLWQRIVDRPKTVGGRGSTAVDANGHVWSVPVEGGHVAAYNPTTNSWKLYGYSNYDAPGTSDIDRKRHQLFLLRAEAGKPYKIQKYDLASPSMNSSPPHTAVATTGSAPMTGNDGRPGFVYADDKDRFYAWSSGRDVYSFNQNTSEWTRHLATGDDPGPAINTGTFGRFRYVKSKGIFILVNDTHKNVFIYKPE